MKLHKYIILICVIFFFENCTHKQFHFNDFVGLWHSDEGGVIILNEDSTCVIQNLNGKYFGYNDSLSYSGKWLLREKDDNGYDVYNIEIWSQDELGYTSLYISLKITGEGLFGTSPPWSLFQYIGDPDEINKYRFVKQN